MNKRDSSSNNVVNQPSKGIHLPQFTRLFPASFSKRFFSVVIKGVIWTLLLFLLVTNVALSHGGFASYFETALRRISHGVTTRSNVLGTTSSGSETSPTIDDLRKQYAHWEKIVEELPDYRDGHFTLATLAYQLGDMDASRKHIIKVKEMDPNFPGLAQLEELLAK